MTWSWDVYILWLFIIYIDDSFVISFNTIYLDFFSCDVYFSFIIIFLILSPPHTHTKQILPVHKIKVKLGCLIKLYQNISLLWLQCLNIFWGLFAAIWYYQVYCLIIRSKFLKRHLYRPLELKISHKGFVSCSVTDSNIENYSNSFIENNLSLKRSQPLALCNNSININTQSLF